MAIRKWLLPEIDTELAATLAEECEINPFLALLLTTRGIETPEEVFSFLLGDEEPDDPFSFADMDLAVQRIELALDRGEKIAVYGDYDVDGITATTLLFTYLRDRGANILFRLPNREGDGYGLHKSVIDEFHEQQVSLIVTVDNGITAVEEVAYATEKGIDVVITDHHQPQEQLPKAVAVIDPHRADCPSGCTDYAGVGVAYMLACALEGDDEPIMERYGDLLALGMLADVMKLVGSVRSLVRRGLGVMNHLRRPGLKALAELSGMLDKELTATRVVFSISPRLNAAGRMEDPTIAAELLMETDPATAGILAQKVHALNAERQAAETKILTEIDGMLGENPARLSDRVLVLAGTDWAPGVIGILAARLTERYGKPTVLLSVADGVAKGSGRSIAGFSLFDALSACSDWLITFGGHELAAGVTLDATGIDQFRTAINEYAASRYPQMPVPELRLDFKLRPESIDNEKLAQIAAMEPFGAGNPAPVFGLFGMRLDNITPLGGGKHLRLSFSKNGTSLSVLKFNTDYQKFPIACGAVMNLAVSLEKNEYKGVVSPTVLLKDMRYAASDETELIETSRRFDAIMRRDTRDAGKGLLPDRDRMGRLYRYLLQKQEFCGTLEQLFRTLDDPAFSMLSIRVLLEIWREAGLISLADYGDRLQIAILPAAGKSDLTATPLWQYLAQS